MSGPPVIRRYQESDKEAILKIAADTAFFGEPVETFLDDRRLFLDIFYRYYTDQEPHHAWVAWDGGRVVGFLMGCVDTARQRRFWISTILPQTAWKILNQRYEIKTKTRVYAWRLVIGMVRNEHTRVNEKIYPAHLHINVAKDWRGQGLGKGLMRAYLEYLCHNRIPGVHLVTTTLNTAAERLYARLGFDLLDERPTHLWEGLVDRPVRNRCYGLRLTQDELSL